MKRAPEEELMDLPLHAEAYANADFSEPNSKFVALFSEKFPAFNGQRIVDLGCGLADITMRLARHYPHARIIGLDGADSMLDIAKKAILRYSSFDNRVDVRKWHIGRQENPLAAKAFQAVVSNSLLHHMCDPLDLWRDRKTMIVALNAVDGATIERRTRINRPDDERAKCKVSRAPDRHKDFSQSM